MDDLTPQLFSWLAAEPAFVQVMLGIVFNLILAPLGIAAVAIGATKIENLLIAIGSTQSGQPAFKERALAMLASVAAPIMDARAVPAKAVGQVSETRRVA